MLSFLKSDLVVLNEVVWVVGFGAEVHDLSCVLKHLYRSRNVFKDFPVLLGSEGEFGPKLCVAAGRGQILT